MGPSIAHGPSNAGDDAHSKKIYRVTNPASIDKKGEQCFDCSELQAGPTSPELKNIANVPRRLLGQGHLRRDKEGRCQSGPLLRPPKLDRNGSSSSTLSQGMGSSILSSPPTPSKAVWKSFFRGTRKAEHGGDSPVPSPKGSSLRRVPTQELDVVECDGLRLQRWDSSSSSIRIGGRRSFLSSASSQHSRGSDSVSNSSMRGSLPKMDSDDPFNDTSISDHRKDPQSFENRLLSHHSSSECCDKLARLLDCDGDGVGTNRSGNFEGRSASQTPFARQRRSTISGRRGVVLEVDEDKGTGGEDWAPLKRMWSDTGTDDSSNDEDDEGPASRLSMITKLREIPSEKELDLLLEF